MSKEQDNINAISKVIDNGVDTFLEGVEKSQTGMFNKTLSIVKELETDINGNIKQTVKNLKLLTRVRKTIVDEILTESYQKRVATFTNQYPAIQELNNSYFKSIEAAFNPNRELYNQIVKNSIQTTRASLLDAGIDQNVIEPIIRILDDSVSTGATFSDMVDELRLVMKGDAERLGKLLRYSTQITQDALNQFNGIYNETIAKDLDLEWYYYSGGRRKTSRPFCKKYAGRYFHKKEVEDFGRKKDLDGSNLCGGTSKTDLCQGRIPGTNKSSIFRYRAGYNCKHIYKPTLIDAVPKFVINRNIKKGYYKPTEEDIEKFNLEEIIKKKKVIKKAPVKKVTKKPEKIKKEDPETIKSFEQAGSETFKYAFNPKNSEGKFALVRYTEGDSSVQNKYLRNASFRKEIMKTKKGAELQKEINKVSKFLDDAPKFEGTTYRGMSLGGEQATTFNQQLKKGGMITDNGFMSTSANKNVAKNFIGTSEFEYKFTIKGKSGVVIEELTEFFGEKEVLFNINTKFKITKVKVTPKQKSVLEKNPITQKNELVLKDVADYEIELEEL